MKGKCSLCGRPYDTFAFKGGFVCEECLKYIKDSFQIDSYVHNSK